MRDNGTHVFTKADTSIIGIIESSIKKGWDKVAYSDYGTDIEYTYADVARKIAALHSLFNDLGLKPGDKIALCDKNSSNWAVSYIAILTYGTVVVPILSDFSVEQIQNIYDHSDSKLMIGRADLPMKSLLDITNWAMVNGKQSIENYDFSGLKKSDVKYFNENPEDVALISYTSGSTGHSKGVMLPYRSLWSNIIFADERLGLTPEVDTISLLPMAHMYGMAFEFLYEFCIRCHVYFLTKTPSPAIILKAFSDVKPKLVIAVPLIIEKIVQSKVFPVLRTKKIRLLMKLPFMKGIIYNRIKEQLIKAFGGEFYEVIVGGAAFNKDVENLLAAIKFPYVVGYGMTECGPIICYEDWHLFVKNSCGKPAPRMEVKIDSADPEKVPGEIITKGTNVMLGYYKNEEETREAIDEDGWLHTGDLGTMDKEGNVFIRGRKKTMLLGANGQNVYPEEIEDIILTQSYFDECVVVQRGEKLAALVYVSDENLQSRGMTREGVRADMNRYRGHLNKMLPKFANLSALELQDEPFEKTPKRSIRRYLYK